MCGTPEPHPATQYQPSLVRPAAETTAYRVPLSSRRVLPLGPAMTRASPVAFGSNFHRSLIVNSTPPRTTRARRGITRGWRAGAVALGESDERRTRTAKRPRGRDPRRSPSRCSAGAPALDHRLSGRLPRQTAPFADVRARRKRALALGSAPTPGAVAARPMRDRPGDEVRQAAALRRCSASPSWRASARRSASSPLPQRREAAPSVACRAAARRSTPRRTPQQWSTRRWRR